jgi:hypothetical protein
MRCLDIVQLRPAKHVVDNCFGRMNPVLRPPQNGQGKRPSRRIAVDVGCGGHGFSCASIQHAMFSMGESKRIVTCSSRTTCAKLVQFFDPVDPPPARLCPAMTLAARQILPRSCRIFCRPCAATVARESDPSPSGTKPGVLSPKQQVYLLFPGQDTSYSLARIFRAHFSSVTSPLIHWPRKAPSTARALCSLPAKAMTGFLGGRRN